MIPTRRLSALVLALLFAAPGFAASKPKVVVLGFDGADYKMVDKLLAEGKLPNIAKLRANGTVSPLLPTNPAQTPVSWSAWATGKNPGKTEIFDFLKRNAGDYYPTFAMNEEKKKPFTLPIFGHELGKDGLVAVGSAAVGVAVLMILMFFRPMRSRPPIAFAITLAAVPVAYVVLSREAALLPKEIPYAINNAKGEAFWELAGKQGLRSRVIHVPDTFPARPVEHGQLVAGLGVPDIRGRVGTPSYYTDDPNLMTGDNEFSLEMRRLSPSVDEWDDQIFGPQNQLFYDKTKDPDKDGVDENGNVKIIKRKLHIKRDKTARTVIVTPEDVAPITIKEGDWSDWVTFDFPFNSLVKLKGFARFRLLSVDPLRLYLSPVNLHPQNPVVFHHSPISQPPGYITKLYKKFGLFKTIGWAVDTWTLSSDLGDEKFFQEDYEKTVAKETEMMAGGSGTRVTSTSTSRPSSSPDGLPT
ncbi:MAG: alkaline phosphatase family protein [Acidobacteriota bacterium]